MQVARAPVARYTAAKLAVSIRASPCLDRQSPLLRDPQIGTTRFSLQLPFGFVKVRLGVGGGGMEASHSFPAAPVSTVLLSVSSWVMRKRTERSGFRLETFTVAQLVKKLPKFYEI
jgi:hypothetical protein